MTTNHISAHTPVPVPFHYSTLTKVITAVGLLALGGLCYTLITSSLETWVMVALSLSVLVLLYPIVSAPVSCTITEEGVTLRRLLYSKTYSRADYSIEERSQVDLRGALRVFGSGGYFGFTGYFYRGGVGVFRLVQTGDAKRYLVLHPRKSGSPLYIGLSA